MFPGDEIIKRGMWLYDGSVPVAVVIARGDVFVGSGDHEDPPDVRDDRHVETFRVWFEVPPGSGEFPSGGGQFLSLREAVEAAEGLVPSDVRWE
jgi:hypothetical protein